MNRTVFEAEKNEGNENFLNQKQPPKHEYENLHLNWI